MSGNLRTPLENIEDSETRQADLDRRRERSAELAASSRPQRPGLIARAVERIRSRIRR